MNEQRLDEFVRQATPEVELGRHRLDGLAAATLFRLPERRSWRDAVRAWWPELVGRYALPMATAAALGLVVGHHILPANPPQAVGFFMSSSLVLAGY
jgi:hypothetical protein